MHISALIHIHLVGVVLVVDEMCPRNLLGIDGHGEIFVPAFGLVNAIRSTCVIISFRMLAAIYAVTSLDKCIMVDVLVTEFAETVSAGLVLDNATEIIRIGISAYRTAGNSRTVSIHHGHALVCRCIHEHDYERLAEVHRRISTLRPLETFVSSWSLYAVLRKIAAELGVNHGIDHTDAAVVRLGNDRIDIEIILIGRIRFNAEEMFEAVLSILLECALGDILGIIAVADKDNVNAGALGGRIQCHDLTIGIIRVILLDIQCATIVFILKSEDNLAASACIFLVCRAVEGTFIYFKLISCPGHLIHRNRNISLAST